MGLYCCALNCSERGGNGYSMFKFPKDPLLCKQWLLAIKRGDFVPTAHSRICSKHFEKKCFEPNRFGARALKEYAIPTIFNYKPIKKRGRSNAARQSPMVVKIEQPEERLSTISSKHMKNDKDHISSQNINLTIYVNKIYCSSKSGHSSMDSISTADNTISNGNQSGLSARSNKRKSFEPELSDDGEEFSLQSLASLDTLSVDDSQLLQSITPDMMDKVKCTVKVNKFFCTNENKHSCRQMNLNSSPIGELNTNSGLKLPKEENESSNIGPLYNDVFNEYNGENRVSYVSLEDESSISSLELSGDESLCSGENGQLTKKKISLNSFTVHDMEDPLKAKLFFSLANSKILSQHKRLKLWKLGALKCETSK